MDADEGVRTEMLLESMLDGSGMQVCFDKRCGTQHAGVHLYGYAVAHTSCAQIVHLAHTRLTGCDVHDDSLILVGQTGFGEFLHALHHQLPCSSHYEDTYHDGGQGVKHRPAVAQEDGATYAYHGTHRGESIAAMMPGVGHHRL